MRGEQPLGKAIDRIHRPLENIAYNLINGFKQAIHALLFAALPEIMGVAGTGRAGVANGANGTMAADGVTPAMPAVIDDPTFAAAAAIQELTNNSYDYLSGDLGACMMEKFASVVGGSSTTQGLSYSLRCRLKAGKDRSSYH
jgi:hypothetical protein